MISYDMALQLKEAGYPQPLRTNHFLYDETDNSVCSFAITFEGSSEGMPDYILAPCLHDLITACGNDFGCLSTTDDPVTHRRVWWCDPYDCPSEGFEQHSHDTPEDAVAELLEWLLKQRAGVGPER